MVLRSEECSKPNIVPYRSVLVIKHQDSGENILKARFVLGGHRDSEREDIVHNFKNIKHSSIILLLALASVCGFEVWSTDVRQAYLQAGANLQRNIYVSQNII